jgi:predicted XRE-type DNA-binding protein
MNNIEIRVALLEAGMKKWELADRLGIPDSSLSRKLRKEIQGDEKQKILELIHGYKKGAVTE